MPPQGLCVLKLGTLVVAEARHGTEAVHRRRVHLTQDDRILDVHRLRGVVGGVGVQLGAPVGFTLQRGAAAQAQSEGLCPWFILPGLEPGAGLRLKEAAGGSGTRLGERQG